jgi:hypothetical protein
MYIMINKLGDMKADILPVADRGENVAPMEPLLISESSRHRGKLTDLAIKLAGKVARFRSSLAPGVCTAFADLVRAMHCYYGNLSYYSDLSKGHDTHPIEFKRALKNDYNADHMSAT